MGPVVPFLSDSPAQLESTVRQIADAGATHVSPIVLHLRPGAREWFMAWLAEHHPDLVPRYRGLYGRGAYAPKDYQQRIGEQVRELAERYHVGRGSPPPKPAHLAPRAPRAPAETAAGTAHPALTARAALQPAVVARCRFATACHTDRGCRLTPVPGPGLPAEPTLTLTSRLGMMCEVPGASAVTSGIPARQLSTPEHLRRTSRL